MMQENAEGQGHPPRSFKRKHAPPQYCANADDGRPSVSGPTELHTTKQSFTAALLHGIHWSVEEPSVTLGDGIQICSVAETQAEALYHRLCREQGIDDGDPFFYDMYLKLDWPDLDCQDENSVVVRACNLLTIIIGTPPGECRVMLSRDGFDSAFWTGRAFDHGAQKDFIMRPGFAEFTGESAKLLQSAWTTQQSLWDRSKTRGRLNEALVAFSCAWRANYVDQMIGHLGTALARLFGADGLEYVASRPEEFASDYGLDGKSPDIIAKLMRLRALSLRGEFPDDRETIDVLREAFPVVAEIFEGVLTTSMLAELADAGGLLGGGRGARLGRRS